MLYPGTARIALLLTVFLACNSGALGQAFTSPASDPPQQAPPRMFLPLPEEEDWSFLANPQLRQESLDRLKYLPLGSSGAYISFGGEGRFYLESIQNENFAPDNRFNSYPELRLLLHADIHFASHFRLFTETQSDGIFGRRGGPRPGVDRDNLDFIAGFLEWHTDKRDDVLRAPELTFRAGRQQFDFGAGRLLSGREGPTGEGPNVLQGFDGLRAIYRRKLWRADLFAAKPTDLREGVFNDGWAAGQGAWGAMLAHEGTPDSATPGLEVFYLGTTRPNAPYFAGIARETRHSISVRAFRANTPWAYDAEAIYQFGDFGSRNIRAWGTAVETSYTFQDAPWSPQPGIRVGVDSGGFSRTTLDDFSVLFPRGAYFGNLSAIGPENTTGVEGALSLHPVRNLTLTGGAFVFWRKSLSDGLYGLAGYPLLSANQALLSANQALLSANQALLPANQARGAGLQPVALVTWRPTPHLTFNAAYEHFRRGDFIREIPSTRSIDYVAFWALFRF